MYKNFHEIFFEKLYSKKFLYSTDILIARSAHLGLKKWHRVIRDETRTKSAYSSTDDIRTQIGDRCSPHIASLRRPPNTNTNSIFALDGPIMRIRGC